MHVLSWRELRLLAGKLDHLEFHRAGAPKTLPLCMAEPTALVTQVVLISSTHACDTSPTHQMIRGLALRRYLSHSLLVMVLFLF
jgi:hypothetical protein